MQPTDHFFEIFFELSNSYRFNVLNMLSEENYNATTIAKHLSITTQETSRHLGRLVNAGLAYKTQTGVYDLTPYGDIIRKSVSGLLFITRNKPYFTEHSVSDLPNRFLSRLNELDTYSQIMDVMVVFANIERIIEEADEYVWRLTNRYNMMSLPELENATERGVEFKLLQTKEFQYPPDWPGPGVILRDARLSGVFEVRHSSTANIFLAMNEKEAAILAFPLNESSFDYRGFSSKDPKFLGWCKEVFEYYWKTASQVN